MGRIRGGEDVRQHGLYIHHPLHALWWQAVPRHGQRDGAVETRHGTSLQGGTATINVRDVPAGVYVLRVTDTNGKEYHQKIVRK
ncbi:MAG: T9SS type A sorting domain-containing protein [Bacteroidales bacterium]|nr:T9SS type A sorting domain-containing protein [Bacteroidales bacterium]